MDGGLRSPCSTEMRSPGSGGSFFLSKSELIQLQPPSSNVAARDAHRRLRETSFTTGKEPLTVEAGQHLGGAGAQTGRSQGIVGQLLKAGARRRLVAGFELGERDQLACRITPDIVVGGQRLQPL